MSVLGSFNLPITRRGRFLEDDFFSGFQRSYSRAVDDVLDKWGAKKSLADRLASYRRLRERDATEDTKAASVTQTQDMTVIVLDMSEFANGEITVQTSGFSAVVQGSAPPHAYTRRFPLPPDTVIDGVVADLSDDNILTITAPRKNGKPTNTTSTASTQPQGGRVVPLQMEQEAASSTSSSTKVQESVCEARQVEQVEAGRGGTRIIPLNIEGDDPPPPPPPRTSSSASSSSTSFSSSQNRILPINRRGRFLQDMSFERAWKDFECALDEVVARKGSRAGLEDDKLQSYRNLRQCVSQEDNQAADLTKDEGEFKIVVDVRDYVDGELDVKAEEGSVVVRGKKGPHSFERRFSVPGLTQPDKVAAALSDDGVLTVTAPL